MVLSACGSTIVVPAKPTTPANETPSLQGPPSTETPSAETTSPIPSQPEVPATQIAYGANGAETIYAFDTSIPKLGTAWRDPSGLIWGAVVTDGDGIHRSALYEEAVAYCSAFGAKLPAPIDVDRLVASMGGRSGTNLGYRGQVLDGSSFSVWLNPRGRFSGTMGSTELCSTQHVVRDPCEATSLHYFRCVVQAE